MLAKPGTDNDSNNRVISNSTGGITLSFNSGNWIRIGQPFENPIVDTVTITVNIESAVSGMKVLILAVDNGTESTISNTILDGNKTSIVVTYTPTSLTQISVDVRTVFGDLKIKNIKMEYGKVATPFVEPDPATELVKCMRYYEVCNCTSKGLDVNETWFGGASFLVPKRVIPSIVLTSKLGTANTLSTYTGSDSSIKLTGLSAPNKVKTNAFPCTEALGYKSYSAFIYADAEIY